MDEVNHLKNGALDAEGTANMYLLFHYPDASLAAKSALVKLLEVVWLSGCAAAEKVLMERAAPVLMWETIVKHYKGDLQAAGQFMEWAIAIQHQQLFARLADIQAEALQEVAVRGTSDKCNRNPGENCPPDHHHASAFVRSLAGV